jgi:MSHA biogenesis protein MshM
VTSVNPFSSLYSRASFLETVGAGEALRCLETGVGAREPFLLLTGESGTGKTTLVHETIARWGARVRVAHLAYPTLAEKELLEAIVLRFGGEPADGAGRPRLMMCLERCVAEIARDGHIALIVVDQAHRWPAPSLDELFLIVNAIHHAQLPLEVLLVGSPELETLIEAPILTPLRERLSVRVRLEPLSSADTRRYLRDRSAAAGEGGAAFFPRKICLEIAALTLGIPRRIDALAGEALRIARQAGEQTIRLDHLHAASEALAGKRRRPATEVDDEEDTLSPIATEPMASAQVTPPSDATATPTRHAERPLPRPVVRRSEAHQPTAPRTDPLPVDPVDVPAVPATHDPGEWISRFVGDQGPIRIGSQVAPASAHAAEPTRDADRSPTEDEQVPPASDEAQAAFGSERPSAARAPHVNGRRLALPALAAVTIILTIVLVMRAGDRSTRGHRPDFAAVASGASTSSSVAKPPRRAVITRVSPARATPPSSAAPKPIPSAVSTDSARAADADIESPKQRYTLAVGEFFDLQVAFDERDRIRELTGMETWVVAASDSLGTHRLVLGIYRSRKRAEAARRLLLDSHTLDAATVAPLPPRDDRQ